MRDSPALALSLSHHRPSVSCEGFWALLYHLFVGGLEHENHQAGGGELTGTHFSDLCN